MPRFSKDSLFNELLRKEQNLRKIWNFTHNTGYAQLGKQFNKFKIKPNNEYFVNQALVWDENNNAILDEEKLEKLYLEQEAIAYGEWTELNRIMTLIRTWR